MRNIHQVKKTRLSINTLQNIQWTDISISEEDNTIIFDDKFLCENENHSLDEQLSNLIGQKDRVSQEIFSAGEKVYFCVNCQLGYHEDSWQYLNQKCEQCKSSNISMYNLKLTCVRETNNLITDEILTNIKFTDITKVNTSNADDLFKQGLEEINRKNYIKANEHFTKILELAPINNTEVYYNRGFTYYKLKKYYEAIEDYNRVIILNHQHANAYANRGNVYYSLGNFLQAIDDYNQALSIKPDHHQARINLDLSRSKLVKTQQVRTNSSSNSIIPNTTEVNNTDYLFRQGVEKIRKKDYINAIQYFTEALGLNIARIRKFSKPKNL